MELDPKIFEYLKKSDPEERKKAVKALAQTEDKSAIPVLAKIYEKDPDADVREMALRAGRHIKKQLHAGNWLSHENENAVYVEVSDDTKREARRLLNKGLQATFAGDYDTAQDLVIQGFIMNPNLQHDREARRVAADVFRMKEQEAIDLIMNPDDE